MLKKKFTEGRTLSSNIFLNNEDHTSDRDFAFQNTLDFETLVNINPIIDLESVEYLPETQNIEIDLFFLKYLTNEDISEISLFIEPDFGDYTSNYVSFNQPKSELFEITTADGLIKPLLNNEVSLSPTEISSLKPQKLLNVLSEINKDYPTKEGYPHFYNSFTLPFWDKKDEWVNANFGFNNKLYTYNSFLLIEIYDDFNIETQRLITTIPVYVSDRYMYNENPSIDSISKQKRPVFNISEGVDGFSFFFLKEYQTSEFYAKFYFWDALNGKKIQFVPSSKDNLPKKWLQSTKDFDQKDLYLKYVIDYEKRSYKIYDLNKNTGFFNIDSTKHIDLYELGYDDYWVKHQINNEQPTNLSTPTENREYGDLRLSELEISNSIVYNGVKIKAQDLKKGINQLYPEEYSRELTSNYYINQEGYQTNSSFNAISRIWNYSIQGGANGYFKKIANTYLGTKTISLLNTENNYCVNTDIESHKFTLGSLLIRNTSGINTYVISDINVSDLTIASNEKEIDLSINGQLTHKTKLSINSEPSVYNENTILPKFNLGSDFEESISTSNLMEKLGSAYNKFLEDNQTIETEVYDYSPSEIQNTKIYDVIKPEIKVKVLASDIINEFNRSFTPPESSSESTPTVQDYDLIKNVTSGEDVVSLLKTDPKLIKNEGITLLVESLDSKIDTNEEIIITTELFLGSGFIKRFGLMDSLKMVGIININLYDNNEGIDSEHITIKIPIKVNIV